MNALALSPVFEQVLGIARLRGLPAPPLQHSYVHGAEDGTTSIRFSPIRCQCQTASGLYTPPPTYSPDGTSPGALVLSRPLPNDPASMASPLTVMPAFHTRFCSIKYLFCSNGDFSPTYTSVLHPNPDELDASDRRCLYTRYTRYSEGSSLRADFSALTIPPAATCGDRLDLYGCQPLALQSEVVQQHFAINLQGNWYNSKVGGIYARVFGPSNCLYPVLALNTDLQPPTLRYQDVDT
ncbi:hypothetical protein BJ912DRAFT_1069883 [Pholiota molesta]|nr:hypothetical protein BJ912DRAFT_1069883 [Pholiota molesta]